MIQTKKLMDIEIYKLIKNKKISTKSLSAALNKPDKALISYIK